MVEKLRKLGFKVDVRAYSMLDGNPQYCCTIRPNDGMEDDVKGHVFADTAPLAICKAAIASLGETP